MEIVYTALYIGKPKFKTVMCYYVDYRNSADNFIGSFAAQ